MTSCYREKVRVHLDAILVYHAFKNPTLLIMLVMSKLSPSLLLAFALPLENHPSQLRIEQPPCFPCLLDNAKLLRRFISPAHPFLHFRLSLLA